MKVNLAGVFAHVYVWLIALAVGAACGAAWALVPLTVGLLLLVVA